MGRSSLVIAVALSAFAAFSVGVKSHLLEHSAATTKLKRGQEAPDFTLADPNGSPLALQDVTKKNKIVLVNFWATWCAPCRIELAHLEQLYKEKKASGLEILAINEDREPGKLVEFLKEKPLSFPVLIDANGEIAKSYGVEGFPTSALLDSSGRIVVVIDGLQPYLDGMIDYRLKASSDG